ncbi:MAG: DUF2304 domain-containing protein [Methanobacteriales archaeon HGW-Methanobacteriales-1]|jgi:hypothetical protein|nr:MAG: DUF2304 domain-containing protein [Methanobacteriales archaeon HGW-Methanobacteriales-1]
MIYQYLGVVIGILAVIIAIIRFRDGKTSSAMLIFWIVIWSVISLVSIFPETTTVFANLFGIGRGLDLILILGLIASYYLIFKLYTLIEKLEMEITELVRQIALNQEENETKKDINEDEDLEE